MDQEKKDASPFAALTYQEQQDRWLEWRSRQLDYRSASSTPPDAPLPLQAPQEEEETPPVSFGPSSFRHPAPTRHRELDEVLRRHAQAKRRAAFFISVNADTGGSAPAPVDAKDTPRS